MHHNHNIVSQVVVTSHQLRQHLEMSRLAAAKEKRFGRLIEISELNINGLKPRLCHAINRLCEHKDLNSLKLVHAYGELLHTETRAFFPLYTLLDHKKMQTRLFGLIILSIW